MKCVCEWKIFQQCQTISSVNTLKVLLIFHREMSQQQKKSEKYDNVFRTIKEKEKKSLKSQVGENVSQHDFVYFAPLALALVVLLNDTFFDITLLSFSFFFAFFFLSFNGIE
jgi:hypothetical protein